MSKTFLQKDWGTVKGISMANAGCGPTAIADIVYNVDKDITPAKVASWMASNKFFIQGGSTRIGISRTLTKYGFQYLYFTPEHTGNEEWKFAFDFIKNSREHECWAILLTVGMKNGGKDNKWTYSGHFIAVTDYDPETGKLYVRDPAGKNTGYHDPNTLKYDTNALWVICKQY